MSNTGNNILHITPHLGGGVGSVVLNWMEKDTSLNVHKIISLDKNNNQDWSYTQTKCFPRVTIFNDCYLQKDFKSFFEIEIKKADIVVVHWWNHPLLYDLLVNYEWPPCRVVMWNHVSGLFSPYIMSERTIDFSDYFIFTSSVSYEAQEIQNLPESKKTKLGVIWSTVGVESFENLERTSHEGFIVGYTGTVDFGKLNPNFVELCANVAIPDIRFVVCSGDSQQHLIDEAKKRNVLDRFSFEGRVPSVVPYLAKYDLFGYPLQPQHFGTCEQSIGEAMMAGAVPIVLDNPTERHIVKHLETGFIANSLEEYSKGIEYLYNNPDVMKRLAKNAKEFAKKQYDIMQTIKQWDELFERMLKTDKKKRRWGIDKKASPAELYLEALGNTSEPLANYMNLKTEETKKAVKRLFGLNRMFFSKGKGSVLQYLKFFPDDENLKEWAEILEKEEEKCLINR